MAQLGSFPAVIAVRRCKIQSTLMACFQGFPGAQPRPDGINVSRRLLHLGGGFKRFFYFVHYLGRGSSLTYFAAGWFNHHLGMCFDNSMILGEHDEHDGLVILALCCASCNLDASVSSIHTYNQHAITCIPILDAYVQIICIDSVLCFNVYTQRILCTHTHILCMLTCCIVLPT